MNVDVDVDVDVADDIDAGCLSSPTVFTVHCAFDNVSLILASNKYVTGRHHWSYCFLYNH